MTNSMAGHTLIDPLDISDDALSEISLILEMRRNFSISVYKDKCMKRRVAIRMRLCRCLDAAAYCTLLRQSEQELDLLQKTITIHVSQFFRNPSMFDKLQTEVLPHLFHMADAAQEQLIFWSLGCAGGEEAYSLAIMLKESFARELLRTPAIIHASDIDADILEAAGLAEYNEDRLTDLPARIRERYFAPDGHRLRLSAKIRGMVSFHQQNIMDVDAFQPCHLVLCRNTLIYFNRQDQETILRGIARILPAGGFLILGKSESLVGDVRRDFATVCPVERVYRRL